MYIEKGKIRAPELRGGEWVNSKQLSLVELRGKVILIDFWDYTCVNCLRTLPYIKEWHARYRDKGLVIIGMHAPEFYFARSIENIEKAIKDFKLDYPVVMDNDYQIWHAFANRYWPAKYLVDKDGYVRYYHFGEGNYIETELAIQIFLREINPGIEFPDPMKPVRDTDYPGVLCYRASPELYLGFSRGRVGNEGGLTPDRVVDYKVPEYLQEDVPYIEGKWVSKPEYIKLADSGEEGHLLLKYTASQVNVVINPEGEKDFKVFIMQDGEYVKPEDGGDDVEFDEVGKSYIIVNEPKMYNLVKNKEFDTRVLKLSSTSGGLAIYAFTFVSCTA